MVDESLMANTDMQLYKNHHENSTNNINYYYHQESTIAGLRLIEVAHPTTGQMLNFNVYSENYFQGKAREFQFKSFLFIYIYICISISIL